MGMTFLEINASEKRNIGIIRITKAILNSFVIMYFENATSKNGMIGRA